MMNFLIGFCFLFFLNLVQTQELTNPGPIEEKKPGNIDESKLIQENSQLKDELQKLREQIEDLSLGNGNRNGTKNIFDAAHHGNLQAVVYYYKQDPQNINRKNTKVKFWSPLMYASRYGHRRVVDYLLSKGADIDTTNSYGDTALMLAAFGGKTNTLEALINKGANLNTQNYKKQTALHLAVEGNQLDAVKFLVQKGADTSLKDNYVENPEAAYSIIEEKTPLELAIHKGKTAIADYLSSIEQKNK